MTAEQARLAGRHLDPTEGVMRAGHIVDARDVAALQTVLAFVAEATAPLTRGTGSQPAWHRDLEQARIDVSQAYAEVAEAKAVLAQREAGYGVAQARLSRAIDAVLYPQAAGP